MAWYEGDCLSCQVHLPYVKYLFTKSTSGSEMLSVVDSIEYLPLFLLCTYSIYFNDPGNLKSYELIGPAESKLVICLISS